MKQSNQPTDHSEGYIQFGKKNNQDIPNTLGPKHCITSATLRSDLPHYKNPVIFSACSRLPFASQHATKQNEQCTCQRKIHVFCFKFIKWKRKVIRTEIIVKEEIHMPTKNKLHNNKTSSFSLVPPHRLSTIPWLNHHHLPEGQGLLMWSVYLVLLPFTSKSWKVILFLLQN